MDFRHCTLCEFVNAPARTLQNVNSDALPLPVASCSYIGCMDWAITYGDPAHRWHEPNTYLLGPAYPLRAMGSAYALSGRVVRYVMAARAGTLRPSGTEGEAGRGGGGVSGFYVEFYVWGGLNVEQRCGAWPGSPGGSASQDVAAYRLGLGSDNREKISAAVSCPTHNSEQSKLLRPKLRCGAACTAWPGPQTAPWACGCWAPTPSTLTTSGWVTVDN